MKKTIFDYLNSFNDNFLFIYLFIYIYSPFIYISKLLYHIGTLRMVP